MKPTVVTAEAEETKVPDGVAAHKFRWQPTVEFVLAMLVIGDALVTFVALGCGYWVRFGSGLVPISADVKVVPTFSEYFNLLVMGTVFLLGTFAYLRLYSRRCLMRYLRAGRV